MSYRDALQHYLDYTEDTHILYHDENVVIIKDLYPKSICHLLVLPRNFTHVHPLKVFQKNPEFYHTIKPYVEKAKEILIDELVNQGVIQDNCSLKEEFKAKYIQGGVHSVPSLRNLHIHVISKDFNSHRLKNRKHYNSFVTKFFRTFESLNPEFNLSASDNVNQPKEINPEFYLKEDLKCIYCGKNFTNIFSLLKVHLEHEFQTNITDKFSNKAIHSK